MSTEGNMKSVLRPRPVVDVSRLEYFNEQGNSYPAGGMPENVILDIVHNGSVYDVILVLRNNNILPEPVLYDIVSYDWERDPDYFIDHFSSYIFGFPHHSPIVVPSARILEKLYHHYSARFRVLIHVSEHANTPTHVLTQILPKKGVQNVSGSYAGTTFDPELSACLNKSTPILEVMVATQWLQPKTSVDIVWGNRYTELLQFMKTKKNVDWSSYPMEWVQEMVWSGLVKTL